MRFLLEQLGTGNEAGAATIAAFRHYRVEEMEKELKGDFERRSV